MVAYIVFTREKMRNPEEYERYREKARPAAKAILGNLWRFTGSMRRWKVRR